MADDRPTNQLTVDDLLNLNFVSDARLHPSEPLVAYVVASGVCEPRRAQPPSRVWLAPTDGSGPARPATSDGARAAHPRWSPDGQRLAYLGSRDGDDPSQLFILERGFGEARRLTDCKGGVTGFAWGPDDGALTLLIVDPPPADEDERKERGQDQIEYERHHRYTRLWRCDAAGGELTPLSTADAQVYEFAWSPDGRELVALIADEPYGWSWYGARLALLDSAAGTFTTLYQSERQHTGPAWSPDSRRIAVIASAFSDQGMTGGDVLLIERDGGQATNLTDGHPRSYLSVVWEPSGERLLATAIEDGESEIGLLSLDGAFETRWRDQVAIHRYGAGGLSGAPSASGRFAIARSDPRNPADVWTVDLSTPQPMWTRHTDMNPTIRERALPQTTTLRWRSFDGQTIQGLVMRPANAPAGPLPLAVYVHGGPTGLWPYEFFAARSMGWAPLLAAAGFAVLLPNPRGSMGFGRAFAEANIGDMGGGDWADVMAGVDECVAQGIADPERLALLGWSYGGYLTAWGVTQTTRFKAAVAGASITNWISFHGVSTIPDFDQTFYPTDPFNWDGPYGHFSPMAHVRNTQTPTLFLHGERDPICPVSQAHEMWRALKELGVESELVVYPREPHGIREREHARDVLERVVGWIVERV